MPEGKWENFLHDLEEYNLDELEKEVYIDGIVDGMLDGIITIDARSKPNYRNTVQQLVLLKWGNITLSECEEILEEIYNSYEQRLDNLSSGGTDVTIRETFEPYEEDSDFCSALGLEEDEEGLDRLIQEIKRGDAELIDRIAKHLFRGYITDDNFSPSNGMSSLEQIVFLLFGCDTYEDTEKILKKIYQRVFALESGCNLSDFV